MRTVILLGFTILAFPACAVQSADVESTGEQSAAIEKYPGPPAPPSPTTIVNCGSTADAKCYECGNSNGVMCCVGKCTVIDAISGRQK